jgi:hypothetical protein
MSYDALQELPMEEVRRMDIGSVVIGCAALGFGITTAGWRLQFIGYSLVLILVGMVFVLAGFLGVSIFSF